MTLDILLVESDSLVRDHIKVGLQQFPEFAVTVATGYRGVDELRSRAFDCVFLGVDPRNPETSGLLQHLRSFDKQSEVIVVTEARNVKDMAADKGRYNVHMFLATPVDPATLFAFVGRFRERRAGKVAPDSGKASQPRAKRTAKATS